jgi:hypothetical protein
MRDDGGNNTMKSDVNVSVVTGSRRLLTYVRIPDSEAGEIKPRVKKDIALGSTADKLNDFRRKVYNDLIFMLSPQCGLLQAELKMEM